MKLPTPSWCLHRTLRLFPGEHGTSDRHRRDLEKLRQNTIYVAKLLIVAALTAAASVMLLAGILLAGIVLRNVTAEVRFGFPVPFASILLQIATMTGLAFLSLAIQHWVSLRWRAFSVATGFGIVATVAAFAMLLAAGQYGNWPRYYPWALPMLVVARQPHTPRLSFGSARSLASSSP